MEADIAVLRWDAEFAQGVFSGLMFVRREAEVWFGAVQQAVNVAVFGG
jgi:hypothetical protein